MRSLRPAFHPPSKNPLAVWPGVSCAVENIGRRNYFTDNLSARMMGVWVFEYSNELTNEAPLTAKNSSHHN